MNGLIPLSKELAGFLGLGLVGGQVSRFDAGYALARGLQVSTAHLGREVCTVLLELLPALETFCQQTANEASDPVGAAIRDAHKVVADVAEETDVDTILMVFDQMDMSYFQPPLTVNSAHQLRRDIRLRLREVLNPRAYQMIDKWRLRGADDDPTPERQSRVIRSKDARPMSES